MRKTERYLIAKMVDRSTIKKNLRGSFKITKLANFQGENINVVKDNNREVMQY